MVLLRPSSRYGAQWLKDSVDTIHTFQGRETDTITLLLGAPAEFQNVARERAAGTPNILNVAVSRARQNLYVVDDAARLIVISATHGLHDRMDGLPDGMPWFMPVIS